MPNPASNVAPELLLALGRVITAWSYVELLLSDLLAHLAHADPTAMLIITQNVASATVTDWIRGLAPMRWGASATDVAAKRFFESIDDARVERNALIHGQWTPGPEPGTAIVETVKLERTEIVRKQLVTAADLQMLLQDIAIIESQLIDIGVDCGFIKA